MKRNRDVRTSSGALSGIAVWVGLGSLTVFSAAYADAALGAADEAARKEADITSASLRVAQVDQGASSQASAQENNSSSTANNPDNVQLNEVLVTAQKRSERLQDVPVPITVVNTEALAETNQTRIQDFFQTVPGLMDTGGNSGTRGGSSLLSIRGLSTGDVTGPTVGILIDDVPYGASTGVGLGSAQFPDVDPSDLARTEVLRGPQGTLYGASTLGGLIKFVTIDPSTDGLSGHVQVLGDDVKSGQAGWGVRGSVNVPLSDDIAIRASAFSRRDPGYVENITTGQSYSNQADVEGGRLAALWRASDALSVKVSALLQNTNGDGDGSIDVNSLGQPLFGDLRQARLRGTGGYSVRLRMYTATVNAKFGDLDFTSISGYSTNTYANVHDATDSFGSFASQFFGVSGAGLGTFLDSKKFTQEFRLASPTDQTFAWLIGAFYNHESNPVNQTNPAIDPATGIKVGDIVDFNYPSSLNEYALFGDLTVNFTDQFNVQLGGRESENRQVYNETDTGPFVPVAEGYPTPLIYATERTKENSFTYLVTPQFKFSPHLMAYARFASGYRPGGPNFTAILYDAPVHYGPDKTYNYELGAKGDLFDHRLTFDASVYYISWRDIQIELTDLNTGLGYFANGGTAKSQGVELSVQARPVDGLELGANFALGDAELTQALPLTSSYGAAGDRLPYSTKFSGSLSAEQDVALAERWQGFAAGVLSYTGDRPGEFAGSATSTRIDLPGYSRLDLRVGLRHDSWTCSLFVNNVTDQRGTLTNFSLGHGFRAVNYIQPRTVGVSVSKNF
jgi:iron complex outermembrane recepter protein